MFHKYMVVNKMNKEELAMERDELIEEISRRKGIAMEEVAEILDEEDAICLEEEEKFVQQMKKKKRRKKMCMLGTITIFLAGAVCALFVLDKKEKISMSDLEDMVKDNVKKYTDKYMDKVKKFS